MADGPILTPVLNFSPLGQKKSLEALVFASEGQKPIRREGGELGNDISQFMADSPILTPVLNFSLLGQIKIIRSPRFCLGGSKSHQEGGRGVRQ